MSFLYSLFHDFWVSLGVKLKKKCFLAQKRKRNRNFFAEKNHFYPEILVSVVVHCGCAVLLFDETSKNILTFEEAVDGFERQGPLYKPFGRGRFLCCVESVFSIFFAISWANI